jgi:aminomethyltransferase
MSVRPTPFHIRTAEGNRDNAWCEKNGFTLAEHFGNANDEAVAARMSAVISDISWRSTLVVSGQRAKDFLSRLSTRDATSLEVGRAQKALWLNDAGAVRGTGAIARLESNEFLIVSAADDRDWIEQAASLFAVGVAHSPRDAGLAVVGPYAAQILEGAGLNVGLELLSLEHVNWQGVEVVLSRLGELGGFEIWSKEDDALVVWDRVLHAGRGLGIIPAGAAAMETLDIEAGVARPWRDFEPARDASATTPTPQALSLEKLVDPEHKTFNGYKNWTASLRRPARRRIAGLVIEGEEPLSFASVEKDGRKVGRTLTSRYSPSLRRAIALAEVDAALAVGMASLNVVAPPSLTAGDGVRIKAQLAPLPFLPLPDSIAT